MSKTELMVIEDIQSRIFTIRGVQVMLDTDLATFYHVETKVLNQAMKRNKSRFPDQFCFQLTDDEMEILKSQIVTSKEPSNLKSQFVTSSWGGRRTRPYAFTEQGVAMLSAVLRSETAVKMSIQIMDAFVKMRYFMLANTQLLQRLDGLDVWRFETDKKMEKVLTALESGEIQPRQGIFYDGQIFDAYIFISDLFKSAKKSITIIDNYLDDSVLTLLTKRKKKVKVILYTKNPSKALIQDVKKCNDQYPPIELKEFKSAHDRFIIIDDKDLYHFGASLKDLGKKWFAFSKMDMGVAGMLAKLEGTGCR